MTNFHARAHIEPENLFVRSFHDPHVYGDPYHKGPIDEARARGRHLFRIEELRTMNSVSDELRHQIEPAQLTGIAFKAIEDYTR